MAKTYRLVGTLLLILLFVGGGAFLGLRLANIGAREVLEQLGIMSTEQRSSSQVIAQDVRTLARLNTVRYTMQQVFPYDFVPDEAAYRRITNKLNESTAPADEVLGEEELRHWRAYNVAVEAGLDPRPEAGEFVVISTTLYVGYRLDAMPGPGENVTPTELVRVRELDEEQTTGEDSTAARRLAEISLPEPSILDIVVQDVRPESYPYPDVELSPEGWRRVASLVREQAPPTAPTEDLYRRARENTEKLLERVLTRAGFDEIRFVSI